MTFSFLYEYLSGINVLNMMYLCYGVVFDSSASILAVKA